MNASAFQPPHGRWLLFDLGEQAYGLPISAVREVVPMTELSQPAGAPACLTGVLNLGGEAVAVVSLRRLFGMPSRPWELYTPLVVLKSTAPALSFVVDRVTQVATVGEDGWHEIPADCSINECAVAALWTVERSAVLLAPDRILLAAEKYRLRDLMHNEQLRVAELSEATA
jgi:purine-binding chemotaxis protein CheW